jgi:O-antigen/teichoic acid export membrane protein
MNQISSSVGKHILDGTTRVFFAECLILPTGLITVVFLTRKLGPENYGFFALSAAIVIWIETSISSLFSRSTVQLVSEAHDWAPIGTSVIRAQLTIGCLSTLLLLLLAGPISDLLDAPVLTTYICFFALDIPFFSLANAHRDIMTGVGFFRGRARMTIWRWLSRLVLIVLLVELGFSVPGAILGSVGASVLGLLISRRYVRPSLLSPNSFPMRRLVLYALPLSLFAISMQAYGKMDLLLLKTLGGSADQAGMYSAAQNLSIVPGILSLSFSPILQSSLGNLLKAGQNEAAAKVVRYTLHAVVWLLPFAAMTAGASSEIVPLIYGERYSSAAPLLAILIHAALAWLTISVASAILIAGGKPSWPFRIIGPMVPLALGGHLLLIPKFGPIGASLVTTLISTFGAVSTIVAVYQVWNSLSLISTIVRSAGVSALVILLAMLWPTPGFLVLFKIFVISLLIVAGVFLLREFGRAEISFVGSMLRLTDRREKRHNFDPAR